MNGRRKARKKNSEVGKTLPVKKVWFSGRFEIDQSGDVDGLVRGKGVEGDERIAVVNSNLVRDWRIDSYDRRLPRETSEGKR